MKKYNVYQQMKPINMLIDAKLKMFLVDTVEAHSGSHAIDLAKQLPKFKEASGLARYPVVHELTARGQEMPLWIIKQQLEAK